MKIIKKNLISLAIQTLTFTAAVAVSPAMAQSSAVLSLQPALLQEMPRVELPVQPEVAYLDQVAQFEMEYGPYDRRLAEPLQAAAAALEEASDPLQALPLYQRALHITRINDGLYSESQLAVVESLIDCLASLEDWREVDRQFRYLHLLYTRLYEAGSAELDRGLAQVSDWYVIAINNDIGSDMMEQLREANKLFRHRLALAEQYGQLDDQVMQLLRHNLEITQYNLRLMTSGGGSASLFGEPSVRARARDQLAQTD